MDEMGHQEWVDRGSVTCYIPAEDQSEFMHFPLSRTGNAPNAIAFEYVENDQPPISDSTPISPVSIDKILDINPSTDVHPNCDNSKKFQFLLGWFHLSPLRKYATSFKNSPDHSFNVSFNADLLDGRHRQLPSIGGQTNGSDCRYQVTNLLPGRHFSRSPASNF
jgi:hypothetical protein